MKALLLVIDFINEIVHPDGKRSSCASYVANHHVMQYANETIAFARHKKLSIIHVKVGFNPNYLDCPTHSPLFGQSQKDKALQLGSWGTEFHTLMDIQDHDTIIIKPRVSALYATPLESILRANNIDTVIVCGVSTNMAIESVTRELHDRDYRVIVVENACGAATTEVHNTSVQALQRISVVCDTQSLPVELDHGSTTTAS